MSPCNDGAKHGSKKSRSQGTHSQDRQTDRQCNPSQTLTKIENPKHLKTSMMYYSINTKEHNQIELCTNSHLALDSSISLGSRAAWNIGRMSREDGMTIPCPWRPAIWFRCKTVFPTATLHHTLRRKSLNNPGIQEFHLTAPGCDEKHGQWGPKLNHGHEPITDQSAPPLNSDNS